MNEPAGTYASADAVRRRNSELDTALRALVDEIRADELHVDPQNGEWTLAENLAHIGEFPRFFRPQLQSCLREDGAVVGRTHEHEGRLAAVAAAPERDLADLRGGVDDALVELADALDELRDEHLVVVTENAKYGPEPLTAFLDRYIVGHKAAHVSQLRETIDAVRALDP